MENKNQNLPKNKFYWLYLAGFLLILYLPLLPLPFVYKTIPALFFPIDWGKTLVFRIILSILIFFFIKQVLYKEIGWNTAINKIKNVLPVFWTLIGLWGVYLLATIFGINPFNSFWGDPFRAGGFLNFSFYLVFAFLVFLIIRRNDWQKLWDFSIFIGILVSLVAIFQQFALFSKIISPLGARPGSTIGNPIFLGIYLLLLTFLTLSFGIKTKGWQKKLFYFLSVFLFIFVSVFIAQTRAVLIGLTFGSLWFLFAYPKKLKLFKISAGVVLILMLIGTFFLSRYFASHLEIYQKMPEILATATDRILVLFEGVKVEEGRLSTWKISWQAIKEKPFLGYGPENFYIAFNKHYNPALPKMVQSPELGVTEWWDRAHNFVMDTLVAGGFFFLIVYLAFFIIFFWHLQKIKKTRMVLTGESDNQAQKNIIYAHAIQATIIGYFVSNIFSFDTFTSYLFFFLMLAYSCQLAVSYNIEAKKENPKRPRPENMLFKYRNIALFACFLALASFLWWGNIKPARAVWKLNIADLYAESRKCNAALSLAEKFSSPPYIAGNYLRMGYAEIIQRCLEKKPEKMLELAEKAVVLLEKNVKEQPQGARDWLLLAEFKNFIIEEKVDLADNKFIPTPAMEKLKSEAEYSFAKASQLSPNRQEIYKEWSKTGLITEDYQLAEQRAQKCIDLNEKYAPCYWLIALIKGHQKDKAGFDKFYSLSVEKGFNPNAEEPLEHLANMYIRTNDYAGLKETYLKMIEISEDINQKAQLEDINKKAQLYASLAVVYKELGEIKKAREAALTALKLQPEAKPIVDEFLKSLEQ